MWYRKLKLPDNLLAVPAHPECLIVQAFRHVLQLPGQWKHAVAFYCVLQLLVWIDRRANNKRLKWNYSMLDVLRWILYQCQALHITRLPCYTMSVAELWFNPANHEPQFFFDSRSLLFWSRGRERHFAHTSTKMLVGYCLETLGSATVINGMTSLKCQSLILPCFLFQMMG